MFKTIKTEYKHGMIHLNSNLNIPEHTLIFLSYRDESVTQNDFHLKAMESSISKLWDNNEDDIYEQLLVDNIYSTY